MTVTAEGVETAEQLILLRHDACEEVQGFYMSRPMTADALARLIEEASSLGKAAPAGHAPPAARITAFPKAVSA